MIRPLSKVRLMPFSTGASPNDLVMFFSSSMVRYYLPRTGRRVSVRPSYGCRPVRRLGSMFGYGCDAVWFARISIVGPGRARMGHGGRKVVERNVNSA